MFPATRGWSDQSSSLSKDKFALNDEEPVTFLGTAAVDSCPATVNGAPAPATAPSGPQGPDLAKNDVSWVASTCGDCSGTEYSPVDGNPSQATAADDFTETAGCQDYTANVWENWNQQDGQPDADESRRAAASDIVRYRVGETTDYLVFEWETRATFTPSTGGHLTQKLFAEIDVNGAADSPRRFDLLVELQANKIEHFNCATGDSKCASSATGWYRAGDDGGDGSVKLYHRGSSAVGGPRVDAPMGVDPSNDSAGSANGYDAGELNLTSATRTEARFTRVILRGGVLVYQIALERAALQSALGGGAALGCLGPQPLAVSVTAREALATERTSSATTFTQPSDHYLCYAAEESSDCPDCERPDHLQVELADRIETRSHDVVGPRRLCTPADATFGGITTHAADLEGVHLEAYRIAEAADAGAEASSLEPPFDQCSRCTGGVSRIDLEVLGGGGVVVATDEDGDVLFDSVVPLHHGALIQVWETPHLGSAVLLSVDGGRPVTLPTSCEQPLGPGLEVGQFRVVAASSADGGGGLCPVIRVDNRFGTRFVAPAAARHLMVPTTKGVGAAPLPTALPLAVNHFKCYDLRGGAQDERLAGAATDQFHRELRLEMGPPTALCLPVRKTVDGLPTEIEDPSHSLMCYAIRRSSASGALPAVRTENQFGSEALALREPVELCVPSASSVSARR